jgi:hypothetical protein
MEINKGLDDEKCRNFTITFTTSILYPLLAGQGIERERKSGRDGGGDITPPAVLTRKLYTLLLVCQHPLEEITSHF